MALACGQQPAALQNYQQAGPQAVTLGPQPEQPSILAGGSLTRQISPRLDIWSRVVHHVVCALLPCQVAGRYPDAAQPLRWQPQTLQAWK